MLQGNDKKVAAALKVLQQAGYSVVNPVQGRTSLNNVVNTLDGDIQEHDVSDEDDEDVASRAHRIEMANSGQLPSVVRFPIGIEIIILASQPYVN